MLSEKPKEESRHSIEYYQQPELYTYIDELNPMMQAAKQSALEHSLTYSFPIGAVIVKNGEIISSSANGNGYHESNLKSPSHKGGCKRRFLSQQLEKSGKPKLRSGEKFELCPGCDPNYHAEARVITEATEPDKLENSTVYLYGHWWCCGDCWDKMEDVGIKQVYLVEKFKDKSNLRQWQDEFIEEKKNASDEK